MTYPVYGHALGIMKFTILVDPTLVIVHYFTLRLSDLCLGVEKKMFKEMMHFHYMSLYGNTLAQEPLPWGSWNLQFW